MLETKIPPPIVTLLAAALMWALATQPPDLHWPFWVRVIDGGLLALAGLLFCGAGWQEFRRARTTVNPLRPDQASTLVTSGVFAISRNPMYLGFTLVLAGWGIYLASPWAVAVLVVYICYMTRFQIAPEERALTSIFGEQFEQYRRQVRRWL